MLRQIDFNQLFFSSPKPYVSKNEDVGGSIIFLRVKQTSWNFAGHVNEAEHFEITKSRNFDLNNFKSVRGKYFFLVKSENSKCRIQKNKRLHTRLGEFYALSV